MQIKNVAQFRSQWRNEQGYQMENWDENFIGSNHGERSGFYKMVNGIVENIKADLTPKLQNAQDEQAMYEFLQNAADSRSTECAIIYDEHYFMVLNNGQPFTEKDLKALLNSFQGTKADKSKPENCDKIGRYGIGFKLAYRLLGKSDGADELVRDLAGPLLFSWHSNDQLQALLQHQAGQAIDLNPRIQTAEAAWLLKIILACFPCAPNETVRDLDYQTRVLFQEQEVSELVAFLQKNKTVLEKLSLQQGSLFFLRFGAKKHEKLKESLLNIKSGIGYSMNTLKTLQKVVLQNEVVERAAVELERFTILPETAEFKRIDPEFPFCPIEIALGLPPTTEQNLALKTSPSLYQFFPMRNERHSLAFFIHGTSFAKITDRTRLDDQGEANIETFKYLAVALRKNLNKYKVDNFDKYALLYKALLLSDRSKEYDAQLLNVHLYEPMLQYIQANIPTRKRNTFPKDLVVLKKTALPLEPMTFGIGKEWFYWTDWAQDEPILKDALNSAKLGVRAWTLRDLILEGNPSLINTWLEDLDEADYQIFIQELRGVTVDAAFLEKFREIKCFKFTDQRGSQQFYALDDLQQAENLFLLNNQTAPIKNIVKALGFAVLEFDVQAYAGILQQLTAQLEYLANDKILFHKIAARTASATLTAPQKQQLFAFLRNLKGVQMDELRQLVLFDNVQGVRGKLQGMLSPAVPMPEWLNDYRINEDEYSGELENYLIQVANRGEAYTQVIYPNWATITQKIAQENEEQVKDFYTQVIELFNARPFQPKVQSFAYIYTNEANGFQPLQQVFYHKNLTQIADYEALRSALVKILQIHLPASSVLEFLQTEPFKTVESIADKDWKTRYNELLQRAQQVELSPTEKRALFALLQIIVPAKDWGMIKLFCNANGDLEILSKLLPASASVEAWLESYKMHASEYDESLQNYLVQEQDIYTNIIFLDWTALTQRTDIRKDIGAFYQRVQQYAQLNKAAKPLTAFKYAFINDEVGFVGAAELFYHQQLHSADDYRYLQTAIPALAGLHLAHAAVLPYLQETIFKSKDCALTKVLKYELVTLNKDEIIAVQKLLDKTNEDFFQALCVEENPNHSKDFWVHKRTHKIIPCYLDKTQQKVAEQLRQMPNSPYKILPIKLYVSELKNKGLVTSVQLFEQLSKSKDTPAELLTAMLAESGNNDLQQQVFSKIDKIVLKQGAVYTKESFEHQALQLFRNKDADYAQVRAKIFIETQAGATHRLTDIAFEPTVTFTIERFGKYTLELNKILPRFVEMQTLLDDIFNKIQDFEAPTLLKRRCFEAAECSPKLILAELKKDFPQLTHAHQLAFALLAAKEANNDKLVRDFVVTTATNEAIALSQYEIWYLRHVPFIEHRAVLNADAYAGLDELLKLSTDKRPYLDFGAAKLALFPYFDKNTFYATPLRSLQEDEEAALVQQNIVSYMFEMWQALDNHIRPVRFDLQTATDGKLLGLDFDTLVYPAAFALPNEQLPAWLAQWLGDDTEEGTWQTLETPSNADVADVSTEVVAAPQTYFIPSGKLGFLYALGINTAKSELVQLRQYLHTGAGEPVTQKLLNELRSQDKNHLENTILWLHSQAVEFSTKDERVVWLRKLYNTLDKLPVLFPIPHLTRAESDDQALFYQLATPDEGDFYYMDARQQTQLREKYNVSVQTVIEAVQHAGNRVSNLDLRLVEQLSTKIEEELDVVQLQTHAQEWGAAHYIKWKNDAPYQVQLFSGKMPYRLQFLGATVKVFEQYNAVLHEQTAFVNRQAANIEEELFHIARPSSLSEPLLLQLLRYKNEAQRETQHATIQKIVEKVVVEDHIEADEEIIENPNAETVKNFKEKPHSQLKVAFDLDNLPDELLESLLQYAKKTKMIVKKSK